MRNNIRSLFCVFLLSMLIIPEQSGVSAQSHNFWSDHYSGPPGNHWEIYSTPEEAGWSSEELVKAGEYFDEIGAAAAMLIYKGRVLVAWGDISRRYMCHSVRKSLFSALFGIYAENGSIDISKTLKELGIDDDPPLTEAEKEACIEHMLMARSGVYHPAAYEARSMKEARPARGSHPPDTYWYYNNWDFNTLVTIFNQETGLDFFETFRQEIADPVGMEDFRLSDTYYHYEYKSSIHPAYPFRLSARDLARFGLLVLNNGKWLDSQIVPEDWIKKMSTSYSQTGWSRGGYGYMWWISGDEMLGDLGMFSAFGAGGHRLDVVPDEDLVFVLRADTYQSRYVPNDQSQDLLKMILRAKKSKSKKNPEVKIMNEDHGSPKKNATTKNLDQLTGEYAFESGFACTVEKNKETLIFHTPVMGTFRLIQAGNNEYQLEDAGYSIIFHQNGSENVNEITMIFSDFDQENGKRIK